MSHNRTTSASKGGTVVDTSWAWQAAVETHKASGESSGRQGRSVQRGEEAAKQCKRRAECRTMTTTVTALLLLCLGSS